MKKKPPVECDIDLDPILKLSVEQRLLIAKRIKESTKEQPHEVHPEVWAEILRRDAQLEADPSLGIPLEEHKKNMAMFIADLKKKGKKAHMAKKRA